MTPETEFRDWMDSGKYERLVREFTVAPMTLEEYTRGEQPRSLSVDSMHALFEQIFIAGWQRRGANSASRRPASN